MAEGVPGSTVRKEFGVLRQAGCVAQGLIGIHATALTASDFTALGAAKGTIVWSPFSNLWLYETTTDIARARASGVRVCLGSDWAPSGTKHLLAELKIASIINETLPPAQRLDARELCELVTANPGDALTIAWGPRIGRIRPDGEADLLVLGKSTSDVYKNLIAARERDVKLVLIGGRAHYGTSTLMRRAGASDDEDLVVAGQKRKVVVRLRGKTDAEMTWSQVISDLERVRRNPVAAWEQANGELAAWGGSLSDPEAPLLLLGDMPDGDAELLGAPREPPADLVIPALDRLWHDKAFLDTTQARNPTLGRLRQWYT
jgi:5-methylthioadenosine/S-adenosylhomocysteine deaminase